CSASGDASDAERHRQLDGRTAETNELAQIARSDLAASDELDGGDIGADRAQIVGDRGVDQKIGAVGVSRDRGVVEMGGPAAVGAAIDYGAVGNAVGGYHDRPGNFDLLLVERRRHWWPRWQGDDGRRRGRKRADRRKEHSSIYGRVFRRK